ncbi:MBL fold metallo-hydrolase [Pseudonocardia sp. KRD291]|uniref:MBL fold metallo-hydrolase n=1 Tax=Pseudonocardia sp. KRD291 TaxID=2792007 RepID=UPI001C4A12A2|nr:MBL fold metallo-hydrolase [Pseudonocardia sp. KRD291]MBW0101299.1 MBL fold metallo-hydrolase [Pseudonocardia sp. KRD291]
MSSAEPAADASLTFVGTATTVLRLGRHTLLTDPNFLHRGQRAKLGYGLSSRRTTDPAMTIADLPSLDAVLLSHLHGDHFDDVARRELDRSLPVLTTPSAARTLRGWGFGSSVGLPTWESHTLGDDAERVRVTAVPGRHGPALLHRALPPVMGTIVDLEQHGRRSLRVYITGDTLNVPELREVRDRYPDVDVMVAHLGGTRIGGVLVTMDAVQGADLVELVRPGAVVPVHYDDYGVFRSPLSHFTDEMRRRGMLDARVRLVARGETAPLPARAVPDPTGR